MDLTKLDPHFRAELIATYGTAEEHTDEEVAKFYEFFLIDQNYFNALERKREAQRKLWLLDGAWGLPPG